MLRGGVGATSVVTRELAIAVAVGCGNCCWTCDAAISGTSAYIVGGLPVKLLALAQEEMELDINSKAAEVARQYKTSRRHTIQVDYVPFMDEIASLIGEHAVRCGHGVTEFV